MDEVLNTDFIFSSEELETSGLFENTEDTEKEEKNTTEEEVNPDDLFTNPESVGSEEYNKEEGDTTSEESNGSSPDSNFYYSIASALAEDGILPDLDQDFIASVDSPDKLAEAIEQQINAKLEEKQKRVTEALEANVEPTEIRRYEQVIEYLSSIKDDNISDESEKGETLRKNLIYQDFLNRGYSKERATREVKKSFDSGSDIEDAKEALSSNIDFYNQQYKDLVREAQEEKQKEQAKTKKEASELKKSLLEDKEVFSGIELDKLTRQKAYDNITKPIHKTDDGEYLTAIQKYELENPVEFRKKLSILFTLTDGFNNIDKLVKGKVNKEVKKNLRELETKLRTTSNRGDFTFVGSNDSPKNSRYVIDI